MLLQKSKIMKEKKRVQSEISKKKNEYSQIFQEIFSKRKLDLNAIQSLKEIFPNNPKFEALLEKIKDLQSDSGRSNNTRERSFINYNTSGVASSIIR